MAESREQSRFKIFSRRAVVLAGMKSALLTALAGRLYYLQVVESDRYNTLAEENRISHRILPPPRGSIFDRHGRPLALNRRNYKVTLVQEQAKNVPNVLSKLARILPLSANDRRRILRDTKRNPSFLPVTVLENLTWEQVSQIEVNSLDLPGVGIEEGLTRHYPQGPTLSHVIGYLGPVKEQELKDDPDPLLDLPGFRTGRIGIERNYEQQLRGKAGSSQVEVNAIGRVIRELSREEGKRGTNLRLTLDLDLQQFAMERLGQEKSASAVVMDVATGEVALMASTPSYDSNMFVTGISRTDWNTLTADPLAPLANKVISGRYNPGSTFKMVVALAALELGIGPKERFYCPGHYDLNEERFHCWKRGGHGHMNMRSAIAESCDVYFYEIALKIGINRIAAMARRLGLGSQVGIDLPSENKGVVPDKTWKKATLSESWLIGETLVAGIGQGYILTTPLQLCTMTARIASGKQVVPQVVMDRVRLEAMAAGKTLTDEEVAALAQPKALDLNPSHLAIIREGMDWVTNTTDGTAHAARIDIEGMEMAGKTGTVQVRSITAWERRHGVLKNEDLPWRKRDHALFVGYAPVERPRYATAVVVEHGGSGSSVAAPIARDLLLETQKRDPSKERGTKNLAIVPQDMY